MSPYQEEKDADLMFAVVKLGCDEMLRELNNPANYEHMRAIK